MSQLLDHFERLVVISLPERAERRARLQTHLTKTHLAKPDELKWVEAVDGRKENIPSWWQSGAGAWGCRLSHLKVLRQAQQDQLENILILEDDVVFHPRSPDWLASVMPHLPTDWGQFFLGGEYHKAPSKTKSPLLVESHGITRTHCKYLQRTYS